MSSDDDNFPPIDIDCGRGYSNVIDRGSDSDDGGGHGNDNGGGHDNRNGGGHGNDNNNIGGAD